MSSEWNYILSNNNSWIRTILSAPWIGSTKSGGVLTVTRTTVRTANFTHIRTISVTATTTVIGAIIPDRPCLFTLNFLGLNTY